MKKILTVILQRRSAVVLWFGLSLFAAIKQAVGHHFNNYLIYKYTFINLINKKNLYLPQPEHYLDVNHYGPLFGMFISPFVWLPDQFAVIVWVLFNATVLYIAIGQLQLPERSKNIVLLLCSHELMTASYNVQFNPCMTAIILLSFTLIRKEKDFWAACMIILGTFIKLYGIVGLAFFFFSQHKINLIFGLICWSALFFLLPMAISSPTFIIQTYHDWLKVLVEKDVENATSLMQDISVMGLIRRIFNQNQLSNGTVILPALLIFGSSYLSVSKFKDKSYQLMILSSTLLFTVLFSSGSESPTYIIAFVGVAVWFVNLAKPATTLEISLLVFAFILTSLSPSDIFPKSFRNDYVIKYALKALPCLLIWLYIVYQTWVRKTNTKYNEILKSY